MQQGPGQLLVTALRIDRAQVHWPPAIRGGLVVGLLACGMIVAGRPNAALPLAVGALFVCVAEMNQPIGHRWRVMLWTTFWLMTGALVGGLVSPFVILVILISIPAALLGGFAPGLGKRAGLAGLLALVVFTISAGTVQSISTAFTSMLLIGLGGVIQTIVVVTPALIRHPRTLALTSEQAEFQLLRTHIKPSDPIFRHAVRLAIALTIGTAISQYFQFEHAYWIPMTVAWMSRPYPTETTIRVIARLIGTIGGVLFASLIIELGQLEGLGLVIPLVIGSIIALAFIWADYAIAVSGITTVIIALFALTGDPVLETAGLRIAATFIAAGIVLIAILFWRTPEPSEPRS